MFSTVARRRPGSCVRKSFLKSELPKIAGGSRGREGDQAEGVVEILERAL